MKVKLAWLAASSMGVLASILSTSAHAQDANQELPNKIALNQFDPSPAGDVFFGLPSPYAQGRVVPRGYVGVDYAAQPLRLSGGGQEKALVGSQVFLHVAASLAILDRALVSVSLPVALAQGGDTLSIDGTDVASPTSAALGDLRIGARVLLYGDDGGPAQIAVGGNVYVPTGSTEATGSFTGDGSARVAPQLLFGGRYKLMPSVTLAYTAMGGFNVRSSKNPTTVIYGAGVAAMLLDEKLQIGPEFYAATPIMPSGFTLLENADVTLNNGSNAEVLLGARYRFWEGLTVGAAGGPGLSKAMGTPAFRFTGMIAWAPVVKSGAQEEQTDDLDKDGVAGAKDACPYAAGPASPDAKKSGCPVIDDDDDGVPNDEDPCPTEYAKATDVTDRKGCPPPPPPPDTDGDTIPDEKDACPKEAGPISQDPAKNGCAPPANPDVDADGVLDAEDACPGEKGVKSADAKASGCKPLVRLKDKQIVILQSIDFRVAKTDLPPIEGASEAVLAQVKETLVEHPEIVKVEIGGHTDNGGKEDYNVKVSKARAEAVKKWLVDHGIAESRLVPVGHGPKKPIADNKTKEGRAQNKRIDFTIVEKK